VCSSAQLQSPTRTAGIDNRFTYQERCKEPVTPHKTNVMQELAPEEKLLSAFQ
jgi:hypothetical protein